MHQKVYSNRPEKYNRSLLRAWLKCVFLNCHIALNCSIVWVFSTVFFPFSESFSRLADWQYNHHQFSLFEVENKTEKMPSLFKEKNQRRVKFNVYRRTWLYHKNSQYLQRKKDESMRRWKSSTNWLKMLK